MDIEKKPTITRRGFIIGGAASVAALGGLSLLSLSPTQTAPATARALPANPPNYNDWREVYSNKWKWDKVVKSTHFVNCWYQAHCAWNVYVKDGLVWREEQVAQYEQTRPELPDFNPRGCQKGACYSERMYDPSRLRYPLKRVGERGGGQWRRVSWEEALNDIADTMIDTMVEDGSDRVIFDGGPGATGGVQSGGGLSFALLTDATVLDCNAEIGDGHRGAAETFGKIGFERSADDYFYSDLILIWGSNPVFTQIPNAHFLMEARYKGAKLVCISPDFSASAVHADLHAQVNPGTDAALGLAICHELIESGQVDEVFIKEQTDLPLLVREDNMRFLRESDLKSGGDEQQLYCYDKNNGLAAVPLATLNLNGLSPELEGRYKVTLSGGEQSGGEQSDGEQVWVTPVYVLLKRKIAQYPPEKASMICGTPVPMIKDLAQLIGQAKSMAMTTSSNIDKYYHGNLVERTQALVFALTGNYGKKGSGFVGFPFFEQDGIEPFITSMFGPDDLLDKGMRNMMMEYVGDMYEGWREDFTDEMKVLALGRMNLRTGMTTSGGLFWFVHGGLLEAGSQKLQEWDPYAKRSADEYFKEMFDKEWQTLWPRPGNDPKIMFHVVSNLLRRIRNSGKVLETLYPKLKMDITLDWRMTSTAMQSDYVLPVAAWYEVTEHKWATQLAPFLTVGEAATKPYYESKSDWEIFSRLSAAISDRAKVRGIDGFTTRHGGERPFDKIYKKFSRNGEYGHNDEDKVAGKMIENASNVDISWEELKKKGFVRFKSLGRGMATTTTATEVKADETITPLTKHVFDKEPYPTLSRRMQFYLDHPLYIELEETLPTHKDPPMVGGNHPLIFSGGHTRWSIHSAWRDDALMLRQQRGEPLVYVNDHDAQARGIKDADYVRVYNDMATVEVLVKVTPAVRPGQVLYYHAWEKFQFRNGIGFQDLFPVPMNPIHCAGGEFHLTACTYFLQHSLTDRDTRVEVALL